MYDASFEALLQKGALTRSWAVRHQPGRLKACHPVPATASRAQQPRRTCRPTLPFRLCSSGCPSLSQAVVKRHIAAAAGAGQAPAAAAARAVAGGHGGWGAGCTAAASAGCRRLWLPC